MTTEEAIKRIQNAQDYSEEEVKQACKEGLQGKHGEFVKKTLEGIYAQR